MTLSASIKHKAPGRLRLQVAEKNFNQGALRDAVQALQKSPSLRRVQGNPLTRTILLEAESEDQLQSALQEVADAHVIHLKPEPVKKQEEPESLRASWGRLCDNADHFLKDHSEGRLDLKTTAVLGLTVLGLGQMTRGHFLPAGMTLIIYAMGMMEQGPEAKKKR